MRTTSGFWTRYTTDKGGVLPRERAWMIDPEDLKGKGSDAGSHKLPYQYGGMIVEAVPTHADIRELAEIVMPLCGLTDRAQWPNACNLNL